MGDSRYAGPPIGPKDDIDFVQLFKTLWSGKWIIAACTAAGAVIAVIVALMLPNIYESEVIVAPNQEESGSGLASLAAQYGGLAGLAGINLGRESSDKTDFGLQILRSRKFIADFVARHDILVPLMAAEDWDLASNQLEIDSDVYDVESGAWVRKPVPPRGARPSRQEAYEAFKKLLTVSQDNQTGFIRISIRHYSPHVAKQWVDWLVQDINATVMQQDVEEAEQAIAYLEEQIAATSLADLQSVFFRLIEEQTKTMMLAKVSSEYLFRTMDPAVAPELKTSPRRSLIALAGLILGGIVGSIVVLTKRRMRAEP